MSNKELHSWQDLNKQYLMTKIRGVKEEITYYKSNKGSANKYIENTQYQKTSDQLRKKLKQPSALDFITETFGLSSFEVKILLMCAGMELDSDFAMLINASHGESGYYHPTFGLALAVFADAHWSAFSPERPLRYWKLIELADPSFLTRSPVKITERILHCLAGFQYLDESLNGFVEPITDHHELVPSHQKIADKIFRFITDEQITTSLPVISLSGNESAEKIEIAAVVCKQLNVRLYIMRANTLPENPVELSNLIRIWNRESALSPGALFLDCSEIDKTRALLVQSIHTFCEKLQGLIFLGVQKWSPLLIRPFYRFEVNKPTEKEQFDLWKTKLNGNAESMDEPIKKLVAQFNMGATSIRKTVEYLNIGIINSPKSGVQSGITDLMWRFCCTQNRPGLDELARRINPIAEWDDLVLPENQKRILTEIAMHVRQKNKIYHEWGFASKTSRGLGISALFTGESGTGKTMAAEVLANELKLDLYRIDLSQVVNKYIGETEKNLKKIFDAADDGGAILLFDEADALFGKRSEVKDSHDRYANIEVSYLLQRMEAYRGLAILTTNLKTSLDKAFMRRLRFVVNFPFPDLSHRKEIWKRVFPSETPRLNLDISKLAKLNITGGNIHNIAMNAAFIAAHENEPVKMEHIQRAARSEYTKLVKSMSTSESETWA